MANDVTDRRADEPHDELAPLLDGPTIPYLQRVLSPRVMGPKLGATLLRFREDVLGSTPETLPAMRSIETFAVPGPADAVSVRVYEPEGVGDEAPCLLYFHGGGWVFGDLDGSDEVCQPIADEVPCVVVSVDYRLAPEHPFPAGFEDCYAATEYVAENPALFGIDPDRIAIGGASAGGNLAAAVALAARDRDGPPIRYQVLVYPATDRSFDTDSYRENASGYLLTRADMELVWKLYLQTDVHDETPYAAPLRARSLRGLPPATVVTAGFDPLRDDGLEYANRLEADGVAVQRHHFDDTVHAFVEKAYECDLTRGYEALAAIGDDLRSALSEERA